MTADILRLPPAGRGRWIAAGLLTTIVLVILLAVATALGAANIVRVVDHRHAARLTVQVPVADAARLLAAIGTMPGVALATPVDRAELLHLLRPWLGDDPAAAGLSVPAMIDIDLRGAADATVVEKALRATGTVIRIDRAGPLLAPVADPLRVLMRLATALAAVLTLAAVAVVALAVRFRLAAQRDTVAVMHMLGATDRQLAALFRRGIAVDTLVAVTIATIVALVVTAMAATRLAAFGSELAGSATLRPLDWATLAAVPPVVVALAMAAASRTVTRTLERMA